jgi:hypothetical protein
MNSVKKYIQLTPLYPPENSGQALKGKFAANKSREKLANISPLRACLPNRQGLGVSKFVEPFIPLI